MEWRIWGVTLLSLLAIVLALWAVERLIWAAGRTAESGGARDKPRRRSTAGAAFALQQIFEPGTEHVVRAEQDQPADEDDDSGEGDRDAPIDTLRAELRESLGRSPIDAEEVRRLLAMAARDGLDCRELFDAAVDSELAVRPYRAPLIPPWSRVAPRGIG